MSMGFSVFDVGRGLCAAVRSPSGHLCVIDCGCSDGSSPILGLANCKWTHHKNYKLAQLIITHPHIDHITDIERVTNILQPFMILRRTDLNWQKVLSGGSDQASAMKHYRQNYIPPGYGFTIEEADKPNWGNDFIMTYHCLSESEAARVSKTDSSYVNNTSYVIVIKYMGYCFVLPGDIELEGMQALLTQDRTLKPAIQSGVDFYVAPHHGHPSGFSSEWFAATGPTKIMNIASEKRKGDNEDEAKVRVDSRYSDDKYCLAGNREGRKLVSTKTDGHIHISVLDNGQWQWEAIK